MKIFRGILICMIALALVGATLPMISINVSSEVPIDNTQSQPIQFNVTILKDELVNASVQALAFDSISSYLYIGTRQGLSILNMNDMVLRNITVADGLAGPNIFAFASDFSRQILYIGCNAINSTDPCGLSIYNTSTEVIRNLRTEDGIPVPWITSLAFDNHTDRLYIGTDSGGLAIYNIFNSIFSIRNNTHGLPSNQILSLELDDTNGKLYIGTLAGLAIYDKNNDSFKVRTTLDGLPENHVSALKLDRIAGKLYIGTLTSNLSIYDMKNDSFSNFDLINYTYGIYGLGDFAHDSANILLYIGGGWEGIYTFDTQEKIFTDRFNENQGLPSGTRILLWAPELNILFVGTPYGLAICNFQYPFAPAINEIPTLDSDGEYIVSWQLSENATSYTLQECNEPNFTSPQIIYTDSSTSAAISNRINGTYYYRVHASNSYGNSAWSEVRSIRVVHPPETPMLEPIVSPDTDGNFTIRWNSILDADNYILEESVQLNFTSSITLYHGANTFFNIANRTDGNYYYRLKALNEGGNSSWSTTSITVIHLPSTPTLVSLPSVDTDGNYTVYWFLISNVEYYVLEEDDDQDFTTPTIVYIGLLNLTNVSGRINGNYYYRVKAVNMVGYSDWSNVQSVSVSIPVDNSPNVSPYILPLASLIGLFLLSTFSYLLWKRRKKKLKNREDDEESEGNT